MKVESRCRRCDEPICWVKRPDGRNISIQPDSYTGDDTYNPDVHRAHLPLCKATAQEGHKDRIRQCRSCAAPIIWLDDVDAGKRIPVNAGTVSPGDVRLDPGRHVSHFRTCSERQDFRGRSHGRG